MYKDFVDFPDIDIPEGKPKEVSKQWLKDTDEESNNKFKATLLNRSAQRIFDLEREILISKYRAIQSKKIDLERPDIKSALLYNEGYLQAIRDIYKLLPRP